MPPCAGIECARQGLPWMHQQPAEEPSSASEAAAAEPARPGPATIMRSLRLSAGSTSVSWRRWMSRFCSSGPAGTLDCSSMPQSTSLKGWSAPDRQARGIEMSHATAAAANSRTQRSSVARKRGPFRPALFQHPHKLQPHDQTSDGSPRVDPRTMHKASCAGDEYNSRAGFRPQKRPETWLIGRAAASTAKTGGRATL